MIQEFKTSICAHLAENPPRVEKCLNLLSHQQIHHKANANSNSIANLILHLNGNLTQYVLSSLGGKLDNRQRDFEFKAQSEIKKDELLQTFSKTIHDCIEVIENCDENELLLSRSVQGFNLTGIGICTHVCEHTSYHVGQITVLTKLLVNKDLGYYQNFDLNITGN